MMSIQNLGSKENVVVEYSSTGNIGTPIPVNFFLWNKNDKNTTFMMGNNRKMPKKKMKT